MTEEQSISHQNVSRQFLTFRISDEHFGLELFQTREILEYEGVTQVPLMPPFLAGVINLRGDVVPILDLAVRLGREPITVHNRTCIIIVELHDGENPITLGLLADSVSEVVELPIMDIEEAPAFGAKIKAEFILGIAKLAEQFVVLLDAEKALSPVELAKIVEAELQ